MTLGLIELIKLLLKPIMNAHKGKKLPNRDFFYCARLAVPEQNHPVLEPIRKINVQNI